MQKKQTLPQNFAELCHRSNLTEFAALFATTDTNATERGSLKKPALSFAELTPEQMRWLLEHGADAEQCARFGETPLIAHANYAASEQSHQKLFDEEGLRFDNTPQQSLEKIALLLASHAHIHAQNHAGDTALHTAAIHPQAIQLLLAHGADIHTRNRQGNTPLHQACFYPEALRVLLEHGADPTLPNQMGDTQLEAALRETGYTNAAYIVPSAEILLAAGIVPNDKSRELVRRISADFEFRRAAPAAAPHIARNETAVLRLCELFGVQSAPARILHNGCSPIVLQGDDWKARYDYAWQLLVPASGHAATVQGEAIHVADRIRSELYRNGKMNWHHGYSAMLAALPHYLRQGNPLPANELAEAENICRTIGETDDTLANRLCELAIRWVAQNSEPIALKSVPYDI